MKVVLALLALLASAEGATCTPGTIQKGSSEDKPFPNQPASFSSLISLQKVEQKTSKTIFEIFDASNNRALIRLTEATGADKNISLSGRQIFNFYSNQVVELFNEFNKQWVCEASRITGRGSETYMFGNSATSSIGDSSKVAFLVNNQFPPVYQGKKVLPETNIEVEWWKDCVHIESLDAIVETNWYFTANTWTSALGAQVPVMLTVEGTANLGGEKGRKVHNVYTFSGYQDFITPREADHFMIPQGTVCPFLKDFKAGQDDKDSHTMPQIAKDGYFSYYTELVQQTSQESALVTNIKEVHDIKLQMSTFYYNPAGLIDMFFVAGANTPLQEVHDFRTGLVYLIDKNGGNCTLAPLALTNNFDVVNVDGRHVRMKTVQEFFGLTNTKDPSMNWTYTGSRKLRDVKADIYVAKRFGVPKGGNSTWEIAFMSPNILNVDRHERDIELQEPMRLWVNMPSIDRQSTYNIFGFDQREPSFGHFDTSTCFTDDQKTEISFELPRNAFEALEIDKKQFQYAILISLMNSLKITPSRLSNIRFEVEGDDGDVIVKCTVLDPPYMLGIAAEKLPASYNLSTADVVSNLKSLIDGGNFAVSLDQGKIKAKKGTFKNGPLILTSTDTVIKLDQGAAAGIGIAFLLVGFGIGILAIFLVNKFRGKSLPNLNLSFSPKTFENEK